MTLILKYNYMKELDINLVLTLDIVPIYKRKCKPLDIKQIKKNRKLNKNKSKKHNKKLLKISYHDYINSYHWINRKRLFYINNNKKCAKCKSKRYIQLHHAIYRNQKFGQEPDSDLFPLCKYCHNDFHEIYVTKGNMLKETLEFINK